MDKTPSSVLSQMLKSYETLIRDPSVSHVAHNRLLKEINHYRQSIKSGKASNDDLYEEIKRVFIDFQTERHKGNLSPELIRKLGNAVSAIYKAADFYVSSRGQILYQISRPILCYPEITL